MFNMRTACDTTHAKSVLRLLLNMLQHVLGNNLQFNSRERQVVNKETPPHWRLQAKIFCNSIFDINFFFRRRRRLKDIHSRSDTNRTGAEGLSFYYPRLLHCLSQMLAVMSLSQHRVSSSKTVRPRAPCGARCIGHAVSTWSAVCSEAPHSQFGEGFFFFF